MTRILAVLMLVGCGGAPELELPVEPVPMLTGDYDAAMRPLTREGTCDFLPVEAFGSMSFDENGQPKSPFPGVDCAADYSSGMLALTCKGYDNRLTATARYTTAKDGRVTLAQGLGEARGNVGGCKLITFQFRFWVHQ